MEKSRKRLIGVAAISWFACLTTVLFAIFIIDGWALSVPDLLGATSATLAASFLVIVLLYLPGLFWLKRRQGGCEPAIWFPLMCALVLNAPMFLLTAIMAGRSLVVAEAFIFIFAFMVLGAVFGFGFVWTYREDTFL
jgi:hypothetical protein